MTDHHHDRSEDLLDALRAALTTTDAVPDEVVAAAKDSFTWRTIDAELAELSYDSLMAVSWPAPAARPRRGPSASSSGRWASRSRSRPTGRPAVSWVRSRPACPSRSRSTTSSGGESHTVVCDRHGRFSVTGVERGAVRLLLRFVPGEGPAMLLTEWVTI